MIKNVIFVQPNTVPAPKTTKKGLLIPRGTDSFVRRNTNGTIDYSFKPINNPIQVELQRSYREERKDINARMFLETKPDLPTLTGATVTIVAVTRPISESGQRLFSSGSGAIMSSSFVFTCDHTFDPINGYPIERIFVSKHPINVETVNIEKDVNLLSATRIPMATYFNPKTSANAFENTTTNDIEWTYGPNDIDFAVLKLDEPMDIPENGFMMLGGGCKIDTALCLSGQPQPDNDGDKEFVELMFPKTYIRKVHGFLRAISSSQIAVSFLKQFFDNAYFGYTDFVVCFGQAIDDHSQVSKYRSANFSMCYSLSADDPDKLEGLAVGGLQGLSTSVYISSTHPAIQAAYLRFIEN